MPTDELLAEIKRLREVLEESNRSTQLYRKRLDILDKQYTKHKNEWYKCDAAQKAEIEQLKFSIKEKDILLQQSRNREESLNYKLRQSWDDNRELRAEVEQLKKQMPFWYEISAAVEAVAKYASLIKRDKE